MTTKPLRTSVFVSDHTKFVKEQDIENVSETTVGRALKPPKREEQETESKLDDTGINTDGNGGAGGGIDVAGIIARELGRDPDLSI